MQPADSRTPSGADDPLALDSPPVLALGAAGTFAWDCDLSSGHVRWWGDVERLSAAGELPGSIAACIELVDRADHGVLESAFGAAVEHRVPIDAELRFRRPDGSVRWVLVKGRVVHDDAGVPVRTLGVVVDIDRHKRAEEEQARLLTEAQEARSAADSARLFREVQEADRIKNRFLAMVSHELRAPLQTIVMWAHLLQSSELDAATRARAIGGIQQSARLQRRLVDDLLDVSRIIAGKLALRFARVDAAAVTHSVVDAIAPGARANGVRVAVDVQGESHHITADPDRLGQIVWNLVSNAVKFTPPGGRVEVRLRSAGTMLEIVVHDTGAGMAPEVLAHVFEPFKQVHPLATAPRGGLGLGLSIVRHLVERHGGSVRAESPGLGRGATFTVQLPVAGAVPPAP